MVDFIWAATLLRHAARDYEGHWHPRGTAINGGCLRSSRISSSYLTCIIIRKRIEKYGWNLLKKESNQPTVATDELFGTISFELAPSATNFRHPWIASWKKNKKRSCLATNPGRITGHPQNICVTPFLKQVLAKRVNCQNSQVWLRLEETKKQTSALCLAFETSLYSMDGFSFPLTTFAIKSTLESESNHWLRQKPGSPTTHYRFAP